MKQSIQDAYIKNEKSVYDLKHQLRQVTDARTRDCDRYNETIKDFREQFGNFQNDCKNVEELKLKNDKIVIQMRHEYKVQINNLNEELHAARREMTELRERQGIDLE